MASKKLFSSKNNSNNVAPANAVNEAAGVAYSREDKAVLAQYACTGCLNGTYYSSDKEQLKTVLSLANKLDPEFVAKVAVYAHQKSFMKDMPAVLAAVVACKNSQILSKIFAKVIDNPKMLRNFIQIIRSGAVGRKSLGTRPKKLIQNYLENLTDEQLFKADVGNDPSLPDIIKMVHPRPSNKHRNAIYAYLLGREYIFEDLPKLIQDFERFKKDPSLEIPNVPFQMLTALPLTGAHWKEIARNATWTQIRMNLNTFDRHNVFNDKHMVSLISEKLADPELIKRSNAFPYQLYTAYQNVVDTMPPRISVALQKAADIACLNIPDYGGKIYVLVDTSGSMGNPISGNRGSVTSKTTCVDVAAVFASAILKKNIDAEIIPFDTRVHNYKFNPMDSIITNAKILSQFGGGGTDCGCAMYYLNTKKAKGSLVILISDNESWSSGGRYYRSGTPLENEWAEFKKRNPEAKMVNIDIQPYPTTQINNKKDVLNLGGFNDQIFEVISKFVKLGNNHDLWIDEIEKNNI